MCLVMQLREINEVIIGSLPVVVFEAGPGVAKFVKECNDYNRNNSPDPLEYASFKDVVKFDGAMAAWRLDHPVRRFNSEIRLSVLDRYIIKPIVIGYYEERLSTTTMYKDNDLSMINSLLKLCDITNCECTCTKDQQTGKDPTVCRTCTAGTRINSIAEEIRAACGELGIA